jgi:AcrR family transcriptional regulator
MATRATKNTRPVEHQDDARRREILREATELFAQQGYRETNLGQIADRLGFRRQAVYHYFKAKDDILYELIAEAGEAMNSSAAPIFEAGKPPEETLTEIVRNHVRVVLSAPDTFRVQFNELNKLSGERAKPLHDGIAAYIRRVADVIAAGQQRGHFFATPPTSLALLIIGMCNSTIGWRDGRRTKASVAEIADSAARLAVAGLRNITD